MAEQIIDEQHPSILDRTIDLTAVSWTTLTWVALGIVAAALRLLQVDAFPLAPGEAHHAFDAFALIRGDTAGPSHDIGNTAPAFLLLRAAAAFLFDASDATARIVPALLGILLVVAIAGLRPFVGQPRALGMAALVTFSPTLVYASRTINREIAVAAFGLVAFVALLRIGLSDDSHHGVRRWSLIYGVALAAMFGCGPSSLSVMLAMGAGVAAAWFSDRTDDSAIRRSFTALKATPEAWIFTLVGAAVTLLVTFTRCFSDLTALAGIGETFADWGRLLTTASTGTPTQFFLLVILLYEILAAVLAVVAAITGAGEGEESLPWVFFGIWFVVALLLFSFSSGRAPDQAIHIVLPLALLGGGELGARIASVRVSNLTRGSAGLLMLFLSGLIVAILSFLVLLGRIDNAVDQTQAIFEAAAALLLAVFPLAYASYALIRGERRNELAGNISTVVLLTFAIFLAAFTIRSSVLLSFYNANSPTELLAQQTSTQGVPQLVKRIRNLARDTTLADGSARDPQGGHGLTIAMDRRVQWPFRWYLRDFPDAAIVADGQANLSEAQVVIAPDDSGMAEAGYTSKTYFTQNRVPGHFLAPSFSNILRSTFFPSHWQDGVRFLLFRTGVDDTQPASVSLGLTGELANKVSPNSGPFGLFERAGAGSGNGQFNQPRGVAASPDGERVYVVDMGNARVESFDATGEFIGSWGGSEDTDLSFGKTPAGLGPSGITVAADGQVYVCDTWNHRMVVLDNGGQLIREIGSFKDNADSVDPGVEAGFFFGPRAVAIYNGEIYVVDTGNERVQVFNQDGSFVRAFGGYGSEPGHLIEPVGIAIGLDGTVYVADSGNARIAVFSSIGTSLAQWPVDAWAGQQYFEPYLTIDLSGNLYATSSATGSIEVFDPTGRPTLSIRQIGSERLQQPVGITTTVDGQILITDKERSAVLQYAPPEDTVGSDGEAPVIFGSPLPEENASPVLELPNPASPIASPVASPQANPFASPAGTGNG